MILGEPVDITPLFVVRGEWRRIVIMQSPGVLCSPESDGGGWAGLSSPQLGWRTYRGERSADGTSRVWIETKLNPDDPPERSALNLHLDVRTHSATGFA